MWREILPQALPDNDEHSTCNGLLLLCSGTAAAPVFLDVLSELAVLHVALSLPVCAGRVNDRSHRRFCGVCCAAPRALLFPLEFMCLMTVPPERPLPPWDLRRSLGMLLELCMTGYVNVGPSALDFCPLTCSGAI